MPIGIVIIDRDFDGVCLSFPPQVDEPMPLVIGMADGKLTARCAAPVMHRFRGASGLTPQSNAVGADT